MDDHFDICHVFEISKFDIARLTCISNLLGHQNCLKRLLKKKKKEQNVFKTDLCLMQVKGSIH